MKGFRMPGKARSLLSESRGEVSVGLSENLHAWRGQARMINESSGLGIKPSTWRQPLLSFGSQWPLSDTETLGQNFDFPKEAKNKKSYVKHLTLKMLTTNLKTVCRLNKTCLWARGGLRGAITPRLLRSGVCRAELSCGGAAGQRCWKKTRENPAREPSCFVSLS